MGWLNLSRRWLVSFWVVSVSGLVVYHNACSKVDFHQSSSESLKSMQSTAGLVINNNADFTNSGLVDLGLESNGADEVYVTNTAGCTDGGQWAPLNPHQNWTLGQKNTEAKVFAKYRNLKEGLETVCVDDAIIHDDVKPSVVLSSPVSATRVPSPVIQFIASDTLSGIDKMYCEWPSITPEICNFSTTRTNLAEGRYLVNIWANDRAGNVSDPQTHDLTVDRTPPVITILSAPPAIGNSTDAFFSFNVLDNLSGVKSVECSWDNNTSFATCASPISRTVAEGNHMLYIRARDKADNEAEISYAFVVDLSAPTVTITSGPKDFSNVNSAQFTFEGKDGNLAITKFDCRLDGAAWAACASPKSYANLTEGLHTFEVRGYDQANNLSAPAARSWYVDLTPPSITFIKKPGPYISVSTTDFKYTVTDTGSGVDRVQCNLDNAGFKECFADGTTLTGLTEGKHTFQVRAYDKATNYRDSEVVTFTVDVKPPTVKFTDTPTPFSNLTEYVFKFEAKDDIGVDRVECRLDAGNFTACDTAMSQRIANLTDGGHQVTLRAFDLAGNRSPETAYAWVVDLKGPTITYFQPPPATILTNQTASLGFTVADPGSGVKTLTCLFDNAPIACESGVILKLPPLSTGFHYFTVTAMDNAGNTSTDTKKITANAPVLKNQAVDIKINPKVDVLVIVDNSGSMATEQANMAARVNKFIEQLATLDWQIGIVTTDVSGDAALKDGRLVALKGLTNEYVLTPAHGTAAQMIFGNTVQMGSSGSGSEWGFKAAIRAIDRAFDGAIVNQPNAKLFRPDAALAAIVLSDSLDDSGTRAEDVIAKVKGKWPQKAFAWHSIVVPGNAYTKPAGGSIDPNDPCKDYRESVQYDGREYLRLSMLTGGIQGNECTEDWGTQLKDIGLSTAQLVTSVTLDCTPLDYDGDGKIDMNDVWVTDSRGLKVTGYSVEGMLVKFQNALPLGISRVQYYCVP